MDLSAAKAQFLTFSKSFASEADRLAFLDWLGREVVVPHLAAATPAKLDSVPEAAESLPSVPPRPCRAEAAAALGRIAGELRGRLPVEAVLPSESVHHPTTGEDAGLTEQNCVHVDSFLYDEEGEEALVQEGKLDRSYCLDCGSRKIEDLTYITHSCSKERLEFIFSELLPSLAGQMVVDVGSRLGAVLWGAYYHSQAARIVGIEINADFCKLQQEVVARHGLEDRVSVVLGNMCAQAELLGSADVTVLNNVFSWFMPEPLQVRMWQSLAASLRPGSLLVTIPSLETSFASLNTGISLEKWVKPMAGYQPTGDDDDQMELSEIKLYKVLSQS